MRRFYLEGLRQSLNHSFLCAPRKPQGSRLRGCPLSSTDPMTWSRQSREDPTSPMQHNQSFFPLKASTRIGCWNVRTLGNPSKQNNRLRDVLRTMEKKKMELLALSEVRWPGQGVVEINGKLILYSGLPVQQSSNHRKGVAMVLSEKSVVA